jgi:hypothetical protein
MLGCALSIEKYSNRFQQFYHVIKHRIEEMLLLYLILIKFGRAVMSAFLHI